MQVYAALALALVTACTSVSADVRRRDIVREVERVTALPEGWWSDQVASIRVVTEPSDAGSEVVREDARAHVIGRELVVEGADGTRWRSPIDAVRALELRRVYTNEARVHSEVDDAGPGFLGIGVLVLGVLAAIALSEEL